MILKCIYLVLFTNLAFAKISHYKNISEDFKVRVKIAKDLSDVVISGTDLKRELHPLNQKRTFAGRKKIKFNCGDFKSTKFSQNSRVLLASLESSTGLITFDKSKYHGSIHIITSEDGKSCDVVNEVDMDMYIGSLLSKEMNASWPMESLKAQAVAARTYALYQISKAKLVENNFYDLENSEKHQVNGDFFDVTQRTLAAARETSGLILTNDKGEVIPAFFHASCGGNTLEPQEVWTSKVYGYSEAECDFCKTKANWNNAIDKSRFISFINWLESKSYISKKISTFKNIVIYPEHKNSNDIKLSIDGKKFDIKKSMFRRYFGRVLFPSNNFYLLSGILEDELSFVGKGNGHGVGLCQVGAKALAVKGLSYTKILSHYFPNLKLTKSL